MLFRKSLNGILSRFHKTVQHLKDFEAQCAGRISFHNERIQDHADQKSFHQGEMSRASAVRTNLERLLNL